MKARVRAACACFGLSLVACAGSVDTPGDARSEVTGDVEIFSWWKSGGELEALLAVVGLYEERYPRATVTNANTGPADKAREQLRKRMVDGLPPDTFQANIGADVNGWVVTNAIDDTESKVENLQAVAAAKGWLDVFDPAVLDAASLSGKLRAVPVNVHRINSLFVRKDLFEKYSLETPTSMPELFALCERIMGDPAIQAEAPSGERMACLGLGNQWNWTLSMLTFEMILPAMAGAKYYEEFWSGKHAGDDPELIAALDAALRLYCGGEDTSDCLSTSYFNPDVDDITWDKGVLKLAERRAMMVAMGDWAKGFLESQGLAPGVDFDIVPFPGSEDAFVFTSDTFPLPKGARNRNGALALLDTFVSVEGQIAFNNLKGSIPVRMDIDASEFDLVTRATMHDFGRATKVLALSGLLPGDLMPALASELKASMQFGSTEIIRNYVRANYDIIKP